MKKIYLLLLLSLLSVPGFSATYYTVHVGDVTNPANWNSSDGGSGITPGALTFGNAGNIWVIQTDGMYIGGGVTWTIAGSLQIKNNSNLIDSSTVGPCTINIGGSLLLNGNGFITSLAGASNLNINLSGNLNVLSTGNFTPLAPTYFHLNFVQPANPPFTAGALTALPRATFAAPDSLTWTSTAASTRTSITVNSVVKLNSNVPLPTNSDIGEIVLDTLICGTYTMSSGGTDSFRISEGSTIFTAHTGGLDSSIQQMSGDSFSVAANYVFNGLAPQVTGFTLPPFMSNGHVIGQGSITIDNPTGVTLSQAIYFYTGNLNLELGVFTVGSLLTMNSNTRVNVDTGNFASVPTYGGLIDLTYKNLGYNALAVNTGNELVPTVDVVVIDKPGATITLSSSPNIWNNLGIDTGTLDASATNYNITLNGNWVNNSGPNAFIARSGAVNFTGTLLFQNSIGGTYPTTFYDVTVNNSDGAVLGQSENVNDILNLSLGNFNVLGYNLTFGPNAPAVTGPLSATSMIVDNGTGQVRKIFTADGAYLFPVGDSTHYSPITLTYSGSLAYDSAAYAGVTVHNHKEPHNTDTTDYLNRYWTVSDSGIVTPSYTATAMYVPADVVGTEGDISMGAYTGTLPWLKFGPANTATHTLTSGVITDSSSVDFTGIETEGPVFTVSADTTLCMPGGFDTLRVLTVVGDTPLSYTWSPAAGLSATTGTAVAATPTVTTTYTVVVTDGNGFTDTVTTTVTVNPAPALDSASNNGPLCTGFTLQLTANNPQNVTGYLWQGPAVITDSTTANASVNDAVTTSSGTYTVTVVNGVGSGCTISYTTTAVVDTFPDSTYVTGGGIFCDTTTIFATNAGTDSIFYQGTTSGGESVDSPAASMLITAVGTNTYYFRAKSPLGCWGPQGSVTVTINALPNPDTASGGGTFCDSTLITSSNGDSGTIYFQGTVAGGTSTSLGGAPQMVTASGTYYFRAQSAAGCWGQQDSVTVVINPTPLPVTVTGGGTFCGMDSIFATGGAGGTIYYEADTTGGMDSLLGTTPQLITASGTYYFRSEALGCWSMQDSAIVVINPLPTIVSITTNGGLNVFCDSTTIFADNADSGTIYFQDTVSGGTSVAAPAVSAFISRIGTYYYHFRAQSALGCWSADDSVQITINPLPTPVTASGSGGPFCGSTFVYGANADSGTIYFEGTAPGGTDITVMADSESVTSTGTYYFRAQSMAGCWSREGVSDDSATVLINPLPPQHTVTGGGSYCFGGPGFDIGLDGSDTGINYQLYSVTDTDTVSVVMNGTENPLDFGTYTAGATYTVIAVNTTTGCRDTTTTSVLINVNPLPAVFTVTGGGPYCFSGAGSDIQLTGSEFGVNYAVYDSVAGTTTLITTEPGQGGGGVPLDLNDFTAVGIYTVVAITDSGCTSNMPGSAAVSTIPLPNLYTASGGGTLCFLDTGYHVFLSGTDTGAQYQLYDNGIPVGAFLTGAGLPLDFGLDTIAGNYTIIATNPLTTCTNTMTDTVVFIVNPLPLPFTVTGGGAYCNLDAGLPVGLSGSEADTISYQLYHAGVADGAALIGTGSAFNFPLQTLAGAYTVVATNPATGCLLHEQGSAAIIINALPVTYTIFGSGSYCAGGAGFNVGISGSQSGITYQLYNTGVAVGSAIPGTGALDTFGHQTAAGTYTVIATNTSTTCFSTVAGAAVIVVNPLPAAYTITGGGSYCAGGAGEDVALSASDLGVNYQLYRNGVNVGGAFPGNGATLDFGLNLAAGAYTAIGTNAVTDCPIDMMDTVNVVVEPLPTVYAITGGGSYCFGGSGVDLGISSSNTGIQYQLMYDGAVSGSPLTGTGGPLDFLLHTAAGAYTAVATNTATTCTDTMSGSETIAINPLPPVHTITGGGVYCSFGPGVDVSLNNSDAGFLYLLYDGVTTIGPPLPGTGAALDFGLQTLGGNYRAVAINTATTCADTMSGSVTITVEGPLVPVVSVAAYPGTHIAVGQQDTLIATVISAGTSPAFQWYINGNLVPGATNDTFAFSIYYNTDSITCVVTSNGTCGGYSTSTSTFIILSGTGVQQVTTAGSDIKLVPNPNKGVFTIKGALGAAADEDVFVEITDMLGQVVYRGKIAAAGGIIDEQIQLSSSLANGMYLLNLRSGSQNNIFHFVIEQ